MDAGLEGKVTNILIMAILLTVGKIALLSGKERRANKQYTRICHSKLKKEMQVAGAKEGLTKGYRLKANLFLYAPELYLFLYHLRKFKK